MRIVIFGEAGEGKTTIAQRIAEVLQVDGHNVNVDFADPVASGQILARRRSVLSRQPCITIQTQRVQKGRHHTADEGPGYFPKPELVDSELTCTCVANGGNSGCPEHDPRKRM